MSLLVVFLLLVLPLPTTCARFSSNWGSSSLWFFVHARGDEGYPRRRPFPSVVRGRRSSEEENAIVPPGVPLGRRERKKLLLRREYEDRRDAWLNRYGSASALRRTFGDDAYDDANAKRRRLGPQETRALYHALLPRSLLALSELGVMEPEDLAPLAYRARMAAKEYARGRSGFVGGVGATLFDRYRRFRDGGYGFRDNGSSSGISMSWEEIWSKYETQIAGEERRHAEDRRAESSRGSRESEGKKARAQPIVDEETLTMRIYVRILERSCATNKAFDDLFLKDHDDGGDDGDDDLAKIARQLEEDIRCILLSPKEAQTVAKKTELIQKIKKKTERDRAKDEKKKRRTNIKRKERAVKKMMKWQQKSNSKREARERDRQTEEENV